MKSGQDTIIEGGLRERAFLAGAIGVWLVYLGVVLLLDRSVLGHRVSLLGLGVSITIAIGASFELLSRCVATQDVRSARTLAGVLIAALAIVLAVDTLHAAYRARGEAVTLSPEVARTRDPVTWIGEVYPPLWAPDGAGARFHKPSYAFRAKHYGDLYAPALLASPTLAHEVFALKDVAVAIDEHGFRSRVDPAAAGIFALGDSFTFGWALTDGKTWVDLLAHRLGEAVYNLGVHDGGPKEQLNLLRYLLQTKPTTFRPRRVIWMLFEGNDLEDDYVPGRSLPPRDSVRGTLMELALDVPYVLRRQSVLGMLARGEVHVSARYAAPSPYVVDGVRIPNPLVYSPTHGHMLWVRDQVERARAPRSYVVEHPNLHSVVEAFRGMMSLTRRHGFDVTVVLMPTAIRLYAPFVEGLDPPIEAPHFLAMLATLAREAGFDVVDMLELLQPYAARELLYFRDDDHCNERGHEVIAQLIAAEQARTGWR